MSKNIKRNTRALQTTYDNYKNRLTQGTREKIQNLINFYEDRKIAQFTTADNLSEEDLTPSQINEIITDKKPSIKKRGAPKYDMNEYKVIMPNAV